MGRVNDISQLPPIADQDERDDIPVDVVRLVYLLLKDQQNRIQRLELEIELLKEQR